MVDGAEVDLAQHVDLRCIFRLIGQGVDLGRFTLGLVFGCIFGCIFGFTLGLSGRFVFFFLGRLVCCGSCGNCGSNRSNGRFGNGLFLFFLYLLLLYFHNGWFRRLAHGSSHGCRFALVGLGLLPDVVQVNLAQRLKLLALFQQFLALGDFLLGLVRLFLLGFLGEDHLGLRLHGLVTAERAHQCLVLLVRDFGVRGHLFLDLAQFFLVFQEINCRLKSYIQF